MAINRKGILLIVVILFTIVALIASVALYNLVYLLYKVPIVMEINAGNGIYPALTALSYAPIMLRNPYTTTNLVSTDYYWNNSYNPLCSFLNLNLSKAVTIHMLCHNVMTFNGPVITYDVTSTYSDPASSVQFKVTVPKAATMTGLVDNGDGTITDYSTGLMWVKDGTGLGCNSGNYLSWDAALIFCSSPTTGLNFAGYNDWRLPNLNELKSILNFANINPAIGTYTGSQFPWTNTISNAYWTSTSFSTNGGAAAYCVNFSNGQIIGQQKTPRNVFMCYVRPVRNAF